MSRISSLPSTPDAIDAEFLSAALDAPVEAVQVDDAHSGTTGRARLAVDWRRSGDGPAHLFAKLPPSDPISRQMVDSTDMGRHEARFYASLACDVPVRVPAPLWSAWGEQSSQYLMLLEDLVDSGCDFPGAQDGDLLGFVRALMGELAALHARFWDWPRHAAAAPWLGAYSRSEWGRILVQSALDSFRDGSSGEFVALAELYLAQRDAFNDFLDRGTHTLVHGDCHFGNLFRDGLRPGFLDWACTAHAPGMRDVAYYLCNSLPIELRRAEERDLLERYREGLARGGVALPPFEETWQEYRGLALTAWIAAVTTAAAGSRMQPLEIGLRAMQRSDAAVQDLDSLGLLRTALAQS